MNPERWKKIKHILEEAIEIAPTSRSSYLDKACGDSLELRREVESLLEFDDKNGMLEQTAFSAVMQNSSKTNAKQIVGKQIGKYKIVGELGTGGMGAVYLAERADGAFNQKVALKIVKRGMDSDAVLRRFINERQILAALEHPNIARLIDGGATDDDLPYFVMEYVKGEPITDYAEKKNLSIEERLKLFREVCAAVSFAHQNLIIHRDLKPSNILVTKDGTPKLLDFGIAKLLNIEADAAQTATQMHVFTPEYASPEQIRGEKLTTATDVYSLGVILYELLTGSRPYKTSNRNISEVIRAVCETEPVRPSSAVSRQSLIVKNSSQNPKQRTADSGQRTKSLKGDLDNIILKALRKETDRRYSSVEQFSEDIRRHLAGLPVTASRDTWSYRASKFVQRNRIGVAAAGLILLTLLGGLAATLYQANVASRERAKAERRFNDVRRLANSFMFEINEEIERSPVRARELLVQRAVEYLDQLSQEAEGNAELESELAAAYEKIGDVQAELYRSSLGKTSDALLSHQKSLQIREKLFSDEPENVARGLDLIKSRLRLGDIYSMTGRIGEARDNYEEAIRLNQQIAALAAGNAEIKRSLARAYNRLGQAVLRSGSLGKAQENYQKALEINQSLVAENPGDIQLQHSTSVFYSYIGYVKLEMGKFDEAEKHFQDALEIERKIWEADKNSKQFRSRLSIAYLWLGVAQHKTGKIRESLAQMQKSLEIQRSIFEADKNNLGEQNSLADCYLEYGLALAKNNQPDAAIESYQKAIENYQTVWRGDEQNLAARRQISFTKIRLADAVLQKGETANALQIYRQTFDEFKNLTAADPNNIEWQHDLAICHLKIGEILLKNDDKNQARSHFEQALPILENLVSKSPENAHKRRNLETVKNHLAKI